MHHIYGCARLRAQRLGSFFEELLYGANVVCTPGVGFGPSGEGYVRFTAFGTHEATEEALQRIQHWHSLTITH